jgi:hypothetical protein
MSRQEKAMAPVPEVFYVECGAVLCQWDLNGFSLPRK